jgi:hypothetical protein
VVILSEQLDGIKIKARSYDEIYQYPEIVNRNNNVYLLSFYLEKDVDLRMIYNKDKQIIENGLAIVDRGSGKIFSL